MKIRRLTEHSFIIRHGLKLPYEQRLAIGEFLAKIFKFKSAWMSNGPGNYPDLIDAGFVNFMPDWDYDAFLFPVSHETVAKRYPDRMPPREKENI
jgi:hypothetical protein